eukprot:SAG31_NODE_1156_length_9616_cov_26.963014_7_plen_302_part_00
MKRAKSGSGKQKSPKAVKEPAAAKPAVASKAAGKRRRTANAKPKKVFRPGTRVSGRVRGVAPPEVPIITDSSEDEEDDDEDDEEAPRQKKAKSNGCDDKDVNETDAAATDDAVAKANSEKSAVNESAAEAEAATLAVEVASKEKAEADLKSKAEAEDTAAEDAAKAKAEEDAAKTARGPVDAPGDSETDEAIPLYAAAQTYFDENGEDPEEREMFEIAADDLGPFYELIDFLSTSKSPKEKILVCVLANLGTNSLILLLFEIRSMFKTYCCRCENSRKSWRSLICKSGLCDGKGPRLSKRC